MVKVKIDVRPAQPDDGEQIGQLIYETVRSINLNDYNQQQVEAWAPDSSIFSTYDESFAYVAEFMGVILGFGNLTSSGYLDRFYTHKDFQGKGVGSLLLESLENKVKELGLAEITTEASITAKPFFEAKGWVVKEQQTKVFRDVSFINYKMYKKIGKKNQK